MKQLGAPFIRSVRRVVLLLIAVLPVVRSQVEEPDDQALAAHGRRDQAGESESERSCQAPFEDLAQRFAALGIWGLRKLCHRASNQRA